MLAPKHIHNYMFIYSFVFQTDRAQYDYKYSMNGWSQVIKVKFNCTAATQGAHHVIRLIFPTTPPSERSSQPCRNKVFEHGSSELHATASTTTTTDPPHLARQNQDGEDRIKKGKNMADVKTIERLI